MKLGMVFVFAASMISAPALATETALYIGQTKNSSVADLQANLVTDSDLLDGKSQNFCYTGDQQEAAALVQAALDRPSGDYNITSLNIDSKSNPSVITVKATFYGEDGGHSTDLDIATCK